MLFKKIITYCFIFNFFFFFYCINSYSGMHEQLGVSTRALSLGNAVTASPPGVMSIHYNPAGLSNLSDREMTAGLLYPVYLEKTSKFAASDKFNGFLGGRYDSNDPVSGTEGTSTSGAMYIPFAGSHSVLIAPNIGFSKRTPDSDFTFAFGIYAPYGVGLSHKDDNDPAHYGGSFVYNQRLVYAAPSVAYNVSDTLSVGFTVCLGQTSEGVKLNFRAPNDIVALTEIIGNILDEFGDIVSFLPYPLLGGGLSLYESFGSLELDVKDTLDTSFNIGVLWEPYSWLSLGICYQSEAKSRPSGRYKFSYKEDWQNFIDWFGEIEGLDVIMELLNLPTESVDDETGTVILDEWTMPQRVQCGIKFSPHKRIKLLFDVAWINWSKIKKDVFIFDQNIQLLQIATLIGYKGGMDRLELERNWEDVWDTYYGVEIDLVSWLTTRFGYQKRKTAVPDSNYDLTWPIQDWEIFSAGVGIAFSSHLSLDLCGSILVGNDHKIDYNQSEILNNSAFTKIIYNPYAGLDYKQDTEALLVSFNINYKW